MVQGEAAVALVVVPVAETKVKNEYSNSMPI